MSCEPQDVNPLFTLAVHFLSFVNHDFLDKFIHHLICKLVKIGIAFNKLDKFAEARY